MNSELGMCIEEAEEDEDGVRLLDGMLREHGRDEIEEAARERAGEG